MRQILLASCCAIAIAAPAHAEKKTATDVQRYANHGQNIGTNVSLSEPAHDGVDNSLSSPSDT